MGTKVDNHHLDSNFVSAQWVNFINKYNLTTQQATQFKHYLDLLVEWNNKFNLTAITNEAEIIKYHFDDSLAISKHLDFQTLQTTADIGTGAGFPGLALKILFPHLHMILIEVNNKKRSFLAHVAQELELENVIIYAEDWRTFLRTVPNKNTLVRGPHLKCNTEWEQIDYFFARASLQPEELVRVFKPSCAYKNAILVYWASEQWKPEKREACFVEKEIVYTLDTVQRKLIFFCTKKLKNN